MDAAAARRAARERDHLDRFAARYVGAEAPPRGGRRRRAARRPRTVRAAPRGERQPAARRARLDRGGTRRLRAARRQPAQRQAVERGQLQLDVRAGRRIFGELIPAYAQRQRGEGQHAARDVLRARRPGRGARGPAAGAGAPALLGAERRLSGLLRLGDRAQGDAAGHRRRRVRIGADEREAGPPIRQSRRWPGQGGKQVWGQMKKSAESAVATGRRRPAGRGARRQAVEGSSTGMIEFHALGHSAGSIFHAYFLPLLVAQKPAGVPPVERPHAALAGAGDHHRSLQGAPQAADRLGQADHAAHDLHDDRRARARRPLAQAVRQVAAVSGQRTRSRTPCRRRSSACRRASSSDLQLIRFFGLAGTREGRRHRVLEDAGRRSADGRSPSRSAHGGFDNDVATMTSVVRRVLDVPDTTAVVDYFEESIPGFDRAAVGAARSARVTPPEPAPRSMHEDSIARAGSPSGRRRKTWTVMVWMAGDNDLEEFGDKDLAEMKRVGLDRRHQHRRAARPACATTARAATVVQRRRRRPTTMSSRSSARPTPAIPMVAIDFFRWAIERYPAERLLGVIWNHGSRHRRHGRLSVGARRDGARGPRAERRRAPGSRGEPSPAVIVAPCSSTTVAQAAHDRAIAFDDTSKDFLDNVELKKVLAEVKRQTGRDHRRARLRRLPDEHDRDRLSVAGHRARRRRIRGVGARRRLALRSRAEGARVSAGHVAGSISARRSSSSMSIPTATRASPSRRSISPSSIRSRHRIDALAKALTKAIKKSPDYTAVTKSLNATQRFDTAGLRRSRPLLPGAVEAVDDERGEGRRPKPRSARSRADDGFVVAERHKGTGVQQRQRRGDLFPARAGQQGVPSARLREDERLAHVSRGVSPGIGDARPRCRA